MANDLVAPEQLSHLPGAPFTEIEVDSAAADVRGAAGWHIAPEQTDTVSLDVASHEHWLRLPTRKLVTVDEVRDVDEAAVIEATKYRVSLQHATVKRAGGHWPSGYQAVEVDMTHGYTETPKDLLAVIAEAANLGRRNQSIRSVQIDDFQQSFATSTNGGPLSTSATLARYSLQYSPAYGLGIA